jgi:NAD(P)H-quinone oxidoreductase subunit 5
MIGKAIAGGWRSFKLAAGFTLGATASYFAWHALFEAVAPHTGVAETVYSTRWMIVLGGLGVLFIAQTILQSSPGGILARFLQPHMHSGLYIDDWFTRLTFRLWPPRFERPTAASSRRASLRPTQEAR